MPHLSFPRKEIAGSYSLIASHKRTKVHSARIQLSVTIAMSWIVYIIVTAQPRDVEEAVGSSDSSISSGPYKQGKNEIKILLREEDWIEWKSKKYRPRF